MEKLKKEVEKAIKDASFIKDVEFTQPLFNKKGKPSLSVNYKDLISGSNQFTGIFGESNILKFIQTVNSLKSIFNDKKDSFNEQTLEELEWLERNGFKYENRPVRFTKAQNFLIDKNSFEVTSNSEEGYFLQVEKIVADDLHSLCQQLNKKLEEKEESLIYIYRNEVGNILIKFHNKIAIRAAILDKKDIK